MIPPRTNSKEGLRDAEPFQHLNKKPLVMRGFCFVPVEHK